MELDKSREIFIRMDRLEKLIKPNMKLEELTPEIIKLSSEIISFQSEYIYNNYFDYNYIFKQSKNSIIFHNALKFKQRKNELKK
jgi:hypothetical protein